MLERLRGVPFNGAKYIAERNVPDPSAGAYHYVPLGREEAGSLKKGAEIYCAENHGAAQPAYAARFYAARPFESTEAREAAGRNGKTGGPHCRASNAGGEKGKRSACEIEKMDIGETMEKRIRVGCYGAKGSIYL